MTSFKGRTAFMKDGKGKDTKYGGRSALGKKMGNVDKAADIDDSNRRVAKSRVGDGGGCSTVFHSRFGK
jgi:hypothetical protein